MIIQLTPSQLQALDAHPGDAARAVDPRTNTTYVLVGEDEYAGLQELLNEDRLQSAIHRTALKNAAGRIDDVP